MSWRVHIAGAILAAMLLGPPVTGAAGVVFARQQVPASAAPASPATEAATTDGTMVLHENVTRVVLDVVVTGPDHQHEMNLSQQDFVVKEDGVVQHVLSFEKHDAASGPDYVPPKLPPLPPNMFVDVPSGPEWGPLNVILYDALDTSVHDQIIARKQLLKFIRQLPSGQRFAVFMLYHHLQLLQGFTSDKNQLLAAVDSHGTWPKVEADYGDTLQSLLSLTEFLSRLPGRKNLLWLSDGFSSDFLTMDVTPGNNSVCPGCGIGYQPNPEVVQKEVKQITNLLTASRTAVYPIDLEGVMGGVGPLLHFEGMDSFARATGGRAFYSTNDVKGAIGEAVDDGGAYYTLTYSPTNKNYDGKLRKIEVTTAHKGDSLAYRRSYYGDQPKSPNPPSPAPQHKDKLASLLFAMDAGTSLSHDILFSAQLHSRPTKASGTIRYRIEYTVPMHQFQVAPRGGQAVPALEFAVAAFDAGGHGLTSLIQRMNGKTAAQPASPAPSNYLVDQQIDVPGKATMLRLAVRDRATNQTGTLEITLPLLAGAR